MSNAKERPIVTGEFVCHTVCYYKSHLWQVGEIFTATPDFQPNQHFSRSGEPEFEAPVRASEDKRSTRQMRDELEEKYHVAKYDGTREEVFALLKKEEAKADRAKRKAAKAAKKKDPDKDDSTEYVPVTVATMTPDEVSELTKAKLGTILDKQYQIKVNVATLNRGPLLDMVLEAEGQATAPPVQ